MSDVQFFLASISLSLGVPLLLALRELYLLRRPPDGGGPQPEPRPIQPRPLPDCLIPRLATHPRIREDA